MVLNYTVAGTSVLDSPGLETVGGVTAVTRTLNIGPSTADLDLEILEHPTPVARILSDPPFTNPIIQPNAQNTVAVIGALVPPSTVPATTQSTTEAIAVAALVATPDCEFVLAGQTHLRLHVPASTLPRRIELVFHAIETA